MLSVQLRSRLARHFGTADWQADLIEKPGFSGLPIYRIRCEGQQFALRAWQNSPSSTTKVEHWDQVVTHLSSSTWNRYLFPRIEKWRGEIAFPLFHTIDDVLWTLASWMEGAPLLAERISEPIRIQLSERLAILHRETATVHSCIGRSLALQERTEVDCWDIPQSNAIRPNPLELLCSIAAGSKGTALLGKISTARIAP
jgi:hypothetical protein